MTTTGLTIRAVRADDIPALVDLGLAAWDPVFRAWSDHLGDELYTLAYPNWRATQADAIRSMVAEHAEHTLVAELTAADGTPACAGFAVVLVHEASENESATGDLDMIAVDPGAQRTGVGMALMDAAVGLMCEHGCTLARIFTGGDDGHAPARALYRRAGFAPLPTETYYRAL